MEESKVVQSIRKYLKSKKYITINFQVVTPSGCPDLVAIDTNGNHIYFEIKDKGGRVSPIQKYRIEQLRKQQCEVYVVYSLTELKEII